MRISVLVEDSTSKCFDIVHGLSFFIETNKHKILFDVGPDGTLLKNASRINLDLSTIDIVVISHGHNDHGGALKKFLEINPKAKIFIQKTAFNNFYSVYQNKKTYIGLDKSLLNSPQIIKVDGNKRIDDELELVVVKDAKNIFDTNNNLYVDDIRDNFMHEHSLLIKNEGKKILFTGCAHNGIINILNSLNNKKIDFCIGGFHLSSSKNNDKISNENLQYIVENLKSYQNTNFYTCHCTGKSAFDFLHSHLENIHYIACGDQLII